MFYQKRGFFNSNRETFTRKINLFQLNLLIVGLTELHSALIIFKHETITDGLWDIYYPGQGLPEGWSIVGLTRENRPPCWWEEESYEFQYEDIGILNNSNTIVFEKAIQEDSPETPILIGTAKNLGWKVKVENGTVAVLGTIKFGEELSGGEIPLRVLPNWYSAEPQWFSAEELQEFVASLQ